AGCSGGAGGFLKSAAMLYQSVGMRESSRTYFRCGTGSAPKYKVPPSQRTRGLVVPPLLPHGVAVAGHSETTAGCTRALRRWPGQVTVSTRRQLVDCSFAAATPGPIHLLRRRRALTLPRLSVGSLSRATLP